MLTDEEYMREALRVARYAEGRTSPNPLVGAVIVKDGRIVAVGWHRKAGSPHAEVHALNMAGELARGATLYVTLEPCSHYGKVPPCALAVIEAGISRVVMAMIDPNPKVAGKGKKMLEEAGIEVVCGVMQEEAEKLNRPFLKWVTQRTPWVTMKMAMTIDGKIATKSGKSQWITNEKSRQIVHELRDKSDAILVGIGTVLADNPSLTSRLPGGMGHNPLRVIVDSQARTPLTANVITDGLAPTLLAVTGTAPPERVAALKKAGAEVVVVNDGEQVDVKKLMSILGERNNTSLLVEGGGTVNYAFLQAGLVDELSAFIAPKLFGGKDALTSVEGNGVDEVADAFALFDVKTELIDGDIYVNGLVRK